MDWKLAIEINHAALKRILAMLVAMAGFAGAAAFTPTRRSDDRRPPLEGEVERRTLPRHLHRAVLRLLRPAEAAVRRLVIVAARGIVVAPLPPRPRKVKAPPSLFVRNGIGTGIVLPPGMTRRDALALLAGFAGARPVRVARSLGFPLFDPVRYPLRRRPPNRTRSVPRIWAPGCANPVFVPVRKPPMPGDLIDATRLGLRLAALGRTLDDLPKQARRFARWRNRVAASARNRESVAAGAQGEGRTANASGFQEKITGRFSRRWPLKPGLPPGACRPGSRRKPHEIDEILSNTHGLAFWSMTHADTS